MRLHEYIFQTGEHGLWECDTLVTDATYRESLRRVIKVKDGVFLTWPPVIYLFSDYGDLAQLSVGPEQGPVWTEIIVPTRTAVERAKQEMIRSLNVMQKGGGAEQQIALPEKVLVPCVITALFTPVLGLPDISRETLLVLSGSIACVWLTDRFGLGYSTERG